MSNIDFYADNWHIINNTKYVFAFNFFLLLWIVLYFYVGNLGGL